jgi:hypothetical protein
MEYAWEDFLVADTLGENEIEKTFVERFDKCKDNYKELTELVMLLNRKVKKYSIDNKNRARLYNKLYEEANDYAITHLKGSELNYYFEAID